MLRDATERPEAILAGTVELVGTDEDKIVERSQALLNDPSLYARMARATNPYGDGKAAERSVAAIAWHLGLADRPMDFKPGPATGQTTDPEQKGMASAVDDL